jgi:hypothetical protein
VNGEMFLEAEHGGGGGGGGGGGARIPTSHAPLTPSPSATPTSATGHLLGWKASFEPTSVGPNPT